MVGHIGKSSDYCTAPLLYYRLWVIFTQSTSQTLKPCDDHVVEIVFSKTNWNDKEAF